MISHVSSVVAWAIGPFILVAGQFGCSRSDRLAVHPVSGTVLVDGKQASGVELRFHPMAEAAVSAAIFPRATTDRAGCYQLSTYRPGDGIPEGDYRVTASWQVLDTADSEEQHPDIAADAVERLAARFTDPATTPLRARVARGKNQIATFDLELAK